MAVPLAALTPASPRGNRLHAISDVDGQPTPQTSPTARGRGISPGGAFSKMEVCPKDVFRPTHEMEGIRRYECGVREAERAEWIARRRQHWFALGTRLTSKRFQDVRVAMHIAEDSERREIAFEEYNARQLQSRLQHEQDFFKTSKLFSKQQSLMSKTAHVGFVMSRNQALQLAEDARDRQNRVLVQAAQKRSELHKAHAAAVEDIAQQCRSTPPCMHPSRAHPRALYLQLIKSSRQPDHVKAPQCVVSMPRSRGGQQQAPRGPTKPHSARQPTSDVLRQARVANGEKRAMSAQNPTRVAEAGNDPLACTR
eukprot:6460645-Amphidinium_carterae.3